MNNQSLPVGSSASSASSPAISVSDLIEEVTNFPPPTPEGEIVIQGRGAQVGNNGLNREIGVFKRALEMFAGMLSKKNVRLVCRGTDCFTDGNLIVIPDLAILDRKNMTPEEQRRAAEFLEAIRGFVSHEVGHVVFTDFNEAKKKSFVRQSQLHHYVWNTVEDAFIEKKMRGLWAGVGQDLLNKSEWALRKIVHPDTWPKVPPVARILAAFLDISDRGGKYDKSWFYKGLHPVLKLALEQLAPEIKACVRATSTKDCVEIAEKIVDKLKLINQNANPIQQLLQQEAKKLKAQKEQEDAEDTDEEPSMAAERSEEDDDNGGSDPEDQDSAEAGGDDSDNEEEESDGGGEGEGDDEGSNGIGTEDDEGEGEEGSGNAYGESEDGEEGDSEDGGSAGGDDGEYDNGGDSEGGGGEDDDGGDSEGDDGGDDESLHTVQRGERNSARAAEEEDEDPSGVAQTVRPNDLYKIDEATSSYSPDNNFSIESLIKEEAQSQLSQAVHQDGYRVFSTEWDKVGPVDDLMPMLMPGYVINEENEKANYAKMAKKADTHIGVMKRRLQAILTTQSKPRHMRNLDDGDLDFSNIHKLALSNDESSKVFKRTTYTFNNNEVCVALVVNESGSMGEHSMVRCTIPDPTGRKHFGSTPLMIPTHEDCVRGWQAGGSAAHQYCRGHGSVTRMELAREVSLIFAETLGALGVPFRLVGHTAEPTAATGGYGVSRQNNKSVVPIRHGQTSHYTRLGALVLAEYKGWEERWQAVKHKMVRMQPRTNTYDGEVLRLVAENIRQRKEKRKVIFMLDDGEPQPSDFNTYQHQQYLKDMVTQVSASGIEVICLSMQCPAAKKYYPNCVVINDVAETPMIATTELKKILFSAMKRSVA